MTHGYHNHTNGTGLLDPAACLAETFPCSSTLSGNAFLLFVYAGILMYAASLIQAGSDKILDANLLPPSFVGGLLLPVLGALPDATVIIISVMGASGPSAQEQLNIGMGTLAGSNIILLTMPWAIALFIGRVPLGKDHGRGRRGRYRTRAQRERLRERRKRKIEGATTSEPSAGVEMVAAASTKEAATEALLSSSSSSSDDLSSSSSSEDDADVASSAAVGITVAREGTKKEATSKRTNKNTHCNKLYSVLNETGVTVYTKVKKTSFAMLMAMSPFVIVQSCAFYGDDDVTRVAGMIGFALCICIFCLYSYGSYNDEKLQKMKLKRAQDHHEWSRFLEEMKNADLNPKGFEIPESVVTQLGKEGAERLKVLLKQQRKQNRLRIKLGYDRGSTLETIPEKLHMDEYLKAKLQEKQGTTLHRSNSYGDDKTNASDADGYSGDNEHIYVRSERILSLNAKPKSLKLRQRRGRSQSGSHTDVDARTFTANLALLNVPRPGSKSKSILNSIAEVAGAGDTVGAFSELDALTKNLRKQMNMESSRDLRSAMAGWVNDQGRMRVIFDAWSGVVGKGLAAETQRAIGEGLDSTERSMAGDPATAKSSASCLSKRGQIGFNGFKSILFGTLLIMYFADPLVTTISKLGPLTGISAFFISMVFVPVASNFSELIGSVLFARKRTKKSLSVIFDMLYGGVIMNNALCLGAFLLLLSMKGLVWKFGSETLALLCVALFVGLIGTCRSTYVTYMGVLVLMMFPLSVLLVVLFRLALPGY